MSKVFIEETTLTNIGSAIREKTGKSDLIAPGDMPAEIRGIVSGGGGDIEPYVLTGNCKCSCYGDLTTHFIKSFGNSITTKDITSAKEMFSTSQLEYIPFELNMKSNYQLLMGNLFYNADKLKELPKINNAYPSEIASTFYGMCSVRNISDDYFNDWNWSVLHTEKNANMTGNFNGCYSLRKIPSSYLKNCVGVQVSTVYHPYKSSFTYCSSLDELKGVGVTTGELTSNMFNSTFSNLTRTKDITFAVNEDGTPKVAKWKSQTIDLLSGVGYTTSTNNIINYNSGITSDKEVKDDATYQVLKEDPDWYTTNTDYSRYNRISAVNTINSLPDTSAYLATAGGTNTIKFKGAAGALTDGGAINTMTEAEIAIATAKGWSVTFS